MSIRGLLPSGVRPHESSPPFVRRRDTPIAVRLVGVGAIRRINGAVPASELGYVSGMTGKKLLQIEDLWKTYPGEAGPTEVLRGVSLTLEAGETLALTGESGSGKSTLLHLAGGLDVPDRGGVHLLGADLGNGSDEVRAQHRRCDIGLVFQQFNLIPSLDVAANIAFQSRLAGRHDPEWCTRLADRLGLAEHLRKYPENLSGGQQQRVAIGRALAGRPALILADEPTGNLDEATGAAVLALMLELVAETGAGLLMVTHSETVARAMSRRLRLRQGQLEGTVAA